MLFTYKDLIVWQKSIELADLIYQLTRQFPTEEKFGLVSQMRRSAVSIASNIAEGRLRGTDKSCRYFFLMSFGSAGELDTQIQIAKRINGIQQIDFLQVESLLTEVLKMLNRMIEQMSSNLSIKH